VGTTNSRLFDSSGDGVRALCTRCGKTWPVDAMSCASCGAELGGETVIDDGSRVETEPAGPRGAGATSSHSDTTPNGEALDSATRLEPGEPSESELPAFGEHTEDDIDQLTAYLPRRPVVAAAAPAGTSSSDPPTRFLRGFDQHIELPNGSIVDDYEIEARLGEGAMGVVYGAKHVKLGRRVAIKVIAPTIGEDRQALARFEREARALASLHHPNIVDISTFGTLPDSRSYFVMEYLVGETLDERLARGRMPLDEALDVLDQIARALEGAHAQGIIHRDLKPSNTFLVRLPREQRSIVKLVDFGLAKLAVPDGVEETASGVVIGTALYLSPEQARGPNVDGRTDVYALGCMAYELVLGRHPFPEVRTATAAIAAHLTEPPPQPRTIWSGIPAALDLLLFSMLAKDPSYRPTLAQVRNVIASLRSPTTVAGRALRAAGEPAKGSALHARAWTAALVAFAVFIGIVIGASITGGKARRDRSAPAVDPAAGSARSSKPMPAPVALDAGPTREPIAPSEPEAIARPAAVKPAPVVKPPVTTEKAVRRPVTQAPSPASAPSSNRSTGTLALDSKPGTDVVVDGEYQGRTPIVALALPPGQHKITLLNETYSIKESFHVVIRQGQIEKVHKDYSDRLPTPPDPHTTINPLPEAR
jgi:serine/threonine-protein kinase